MLRAVDPGSAGEPRAQALGGRGVGQRLVDARADAPVRSTPSPNGRRMEVIVVEAVGGETRRRLREHRPAVEVIEVRRAGGPSPPSATWASAGRRGDLVAILEDHGEVGPGLGLGPDRGPRRAAGGRSAAWSRTAATAWSTGPRSSASTPPTWGRSLEGESADLPGNNIAYKRPHLLRHAGELEQGRWESWINDKIRADGVPIASTNRAVVRHIKPFRLGHFLAQRFHFARSYAGMRRVDQSPARRLVYGFGSLALPALLTLRVTRTALGKRRHLGRFAASLPLIALFYTVGAAGEMVGYLVGPGDSLSRVE